MYILQRSIQIHFHYKRNNIDLHIKIIIIIIYSSWSSWSSWSFTHHDDNPRPGEEPADVPGDSSVRDVTTRPWRHSDLQGQQQGRPVQVAEGRQGEHWKYFRLSMIKYFNLHWLGYAYPDRDLFMKWCKLLPFWGLAEYQEENGIFFFRLMQI